MIKLELWTRQFPRVNALLLILIIFPVFILPALPASYTSFLYPPFFTGIFICAALSIQTHRKIVVNFAALLILLFWISYIGNLRTLKVIIRFLQIIFFVFMVIGLVKDISTTPTVTKTVIVDAITGYLLLGFAFSLLVTVIAGFMPDAYSSTKYALDAGTNFDPVRENIYYVFVTYTTTGYGDIVPVAPIAKSLSVLISVSGQLYVAIIIAMLVGKYASVRS